MTRGLRVSVLACLVGVAWLSPVVAFAYGLSPVGSLSASSSGSSDTSFLLLWRGSSAVSSSLSGQNFGHVPGVLPSIEPVWTDERDAALVTAAGLVTMAATALMVASWARTR